MAKREIVEWRLLTGHHKYHTLDCHIVSLSPYTENEHCFSLAVNLDTAAPEVVVERPPYSRVYHSKKMLKQ